MDIALKRTNKFENLSTRGRQVKREGDNIGLPTSESKRTKRNPLTSFQNILSNRPTIRLKKTVVQAAADKAKVSSDERIKSAPQDKPAPLKKKADRIADQENVDPASRIPVPRERRTIFGNPFTKKKSAQLIPFLPRQEPAPLGAKQHLVKTRVPVTQGEDSKPRSVVTQSKGTRATSATSHPVAPGPPADVSKRVALTKSGTLSSALSSVSATTALKGVSQIHLAAPEMKRKPLAIISQTGTNSDSSSSSIASQPVALGVSSRLVMNQSLNSSFLQTFSNMNTIDQRASQKLSKENPPSGPYLRFSNRPALQTARVSDPATSHLLLLPQTTELSCTPVKNDVIMQSPGSVPQLSDPLLDLDCISTQYLLCPEYGQGVFVYLKGIQSRFMPAVAYLSKQQDINEGMRAILVDWLVEVSTEYKLNTQTLFLAVNYIDRFLSLMSVSRTKLQLVGTCCMYVASKFEEIYPPDLSEFAFITDDTYTKRQVVRMEALILKALEFNLLAPTANLFAERFIRAVTSCPDKFKHLVAYLCELALLSDKIILRYHPSMVAASAISLAAETLGLPAWSAALTRHTGYNWLEIQSCRTLLHLQFHSAPNLCQQAIQTKYRSADYHGVSSLSLSLPKH